MKYISWLDLQDFILRGIRIECVNKIAACIDVNFNKFDERFDNKFNNMHKEFKFNFLESIRFNIKTALNR